MRALYPFFRLAARPSIVVGFLWAVWMFCMYPVVILVDGSPSLLDITSTGQLSPERWRALWRTALLFPASGALMAAVISREVLHGGWSWVVPSVRTRFVQGVALLGAALSLPMPVLLARMDGGPAAMAAFGAGAFAFGATGLVFSRMLMRWESRLALAVMVAAIWRADAIAALAVAHPSFVTIVALDGAGLSLYLSYSTNSVRQLVALSSPQRWWQRKRTGASERARLWTRPLARGRIVDWVLAGEYETWGSRVRFGSVWMLAGIFVLLGAFASLYSIGEAPRDTGELVAYVLGFQAAGLAPFAIAVLPPLVRTDRAYPLSRRQRAAVTWWGSLATALAFGLVASVCLLLLGLLIPLLPWWTAGALPLRDLLQYLPHGLLWLPVLLWVQTRYVRVDRMMMTRGGSGPRTERGGKQLMVGLALFVTATMGTHGLLVQRAVLGTGLVRIVSLIALAALVQLTYWLLLRRHFDRGDLV